MEARHEQGARHTHRPGEARYGPPLAELSPHQLDCMGDGRLLQRTDLQDARALGIQQKPC